MKKIILLAIFIAAAVSLSAQNRVVVVVDGIEEVKGSLMVAVNSEETYMKKPYKSAIVKVTDTTMEVTFDLPDGDYSISVFQDANDNKKLDTGAYGIPIEKWGYSNNAVGNMGPPTFSDTKVSINKNQVIRITLN